MKARIGWTVAVLILVSSSSEAGLFKRAGKYSPPKAIALLSQGADETHKFVKGTPGPAKYQKIEWGTIWKQSLRMQGSDRVGHYNEIY